MLEHRNRGVGKVMAKAFVLLAPLLGYRASMFNLVFENNLGSLLLWRNLGFREIGRLPGGARVRQEDGSERYEDVVMFHYDFINGTHKS
ncbi:hypothetical protein HDU96_006418 [Phlyctochytrium bullatum]|nr:hypothetical protein HDU96_006418 [Phlyctochytrium bullatum]